MAIPDFRFNGQQSYSPLLSALAEAPANKAKLQIAQEQNQRQRLSDLLTNISSAAATARQVQLIHQQSVEQGARESAANAMTTPQNKNLFLGNLAFQSAFGGMAGTGAGIDTMFNGAGSQPSAPSQGVTGIGEAVDPQALIQKLKLRAAGANPTQGTDPNTGLPTENYLGTGIAPKVINPPAEGELAPVQKTALMDQVSKFRSDPDYKNYASQIQAARNLKMAVNSENPIARLQVLAGQVRESGINRVTLPELQMGGHDPSAWESLRQKFETAATGKFTKINKDELNSLADMMMSAGQAGIKNLSNSYSGDFKTANPKSANAKIVDSMFAQAVAPHMQGPIKTKTFKKNPNKSTDLGNGFSYSIK